MPSLLPRLQADYVPKSRFESPTQIPDDLNEQFLRLLAVSGQVNWAAQQVGVSKGTMYNRRSRDPKFARQWDLAVKAATEDRAAAILAGVDEHITSHLRAQIVPLTNEHGDPVLDENFDQVHVSSISFRDLASMRRAVAAATPDVQVNLQQNFGGDTVPVLEHDAIDVDAVLAEIDADE
jgi:hypothetical protein